MSALERKLAAGQFVVTAELPVIDSGGHAEIRRQLAPMEPFVDAFNATDNPSAHAHCSPLAVAIGAFGTSKLVFLKEVGVGLGVAVLLDATLIRSVLLPASMKLLGNANWWMPRGAARALVSREPKVETGAPATESL